MATKTASCPHPPDGVLACGCTDDVVDRMFEEAGVAAAHRGPQRNLWATVQAHVAPHFGPHQGVLHDADAGPVRADVIVHAPSPQRPSVDLVTAGMSLRRMRPPKALRRRGGPMRAELILRLPPPPGRIALEAVLRAKRAWPLLLLQVVARAPHQFSRFLGDVPGLPPDFRVLPISGAVRGFPYDAVLAADPARFGRPIPPLRHFDAKSRAARDCVTFLSLVPLYKSELEFTIDHGAEPLFRRLADAGVEDLVQPKRAPVV